LEIDMEFARALEPPRFALTFYRQHFLLVFGLSLIPSGQRYLSQIFDSSIPSALDLPLELLTQCARVALLIIVFRRAVPRMSFEQLWLRAKSFADAHWQSLVWQAVLLTGLTAIFKVVPDVLVPLWTEVGPQYWGTLLAVKNVTVIAFALLWTIGAIQQMARYEPAPAYPTAGS
jgi:hypothetical protein